MNIGKIINCINDIVDIKFKNNCIPKIGNILKTINVKDINLKFEVIKHLSKNVIRSIPLGDINGISKNTKIINTNQYINIPLGELLLGRVINNIGEVIDDLNFNNNKKLYINNKFYNYNILNISKEILYTGIKLIDVMCPILKGSKVGIFGNIGLGKTINIMELINNTSKFSKTISIFSGSENKNSYFYNKMINSNIINLSDLNKSKIIIIYNQMNNIYGNRLNILTGNNISEYFKNKGHDIIFFNDKILCYSLTGLEILTLLNCTLPNFKNNLEFEQEINNLKYNKLINKKGSITYIQNIYTSEEELLDSNFINIFPYLDTSIIFSKEMVNNNLHPAIDPLNSSSKYLDPNIIGNKHYLIVKDIRNILQKYKKLKNILLFNNINSLSNEDKIIINRSKKIEIFFTQSLNILNKVDKKINIEDSLNILKMIINGYFDNLSINNFKIKYNII